MTQADPENQVDRFILDEIDSVPHLEALLLLWRNKEKTWRVEEMARSLYVKAEQADNILQDLVRRNLVVVCTEGERVYAYDSSSENQNALLRQVDQTYRRELIRVSRMIHSKAAPAIRDFARAFRFTKEKE
jgi:DNA-binding MarR family transcriptional regulator